MVAGDGNSGETLSQKQLEESLAAWLSERIPPNLSWDNVRAHLSQGTMLLIFDGMDEVPVSSESGAGKWYPRTLLLSGLSSVIPSWGKSGNRLMLTSRPYGVGDSDRQRLRLKHAPIQELLSRTGLLLSRGDHEAAFYHLSIQEFLAAQRLWALHSDNLARVFVERGDVAEWRNTLSFLFGMQLSRIGTADPSIRLLEKLIGEVGNEQVGLQIVLGDCLHILMGKGSRVSQESEERYQRLCIDAIEREVPLRERHLIGLALGHVGDPRIEGDLRKDAGYVTIPPGTYAYQDGKQEIEKPFLLSRFPVTNSQYSLFIEDKGYERPEFWSEEGWRERSESDWTEPRYWRDPSRNAPNQPVVGVSWYEAQAFCKWAGGELPSEKQWEAAARGKDGHEFPWGGPWEDGICNTEEAGLKVTTPVGLFPKSCSVNFGLEDMSGNVMEWCANRDDYGWPVSRGGSYNYVASWTRGATRFLNSNADLRVGTIGFRVARTYH